MATGDQQDMLGRMKAVIPTRWTSDVPLTPILDGTLTGIAFIWAYVYGLFLWAKLQTRIATSTGVMLDISALDYFGSGLSRNPGETDSTFSTRIRANLLPPGVTRAAVSQAVKGLTGVAPIIFEPADTGDTGGYGGGEAKVWTGLAYGKAGGYGSLALPFQAFITVFPPPSGGVPNVNGYGGYLGGYGAGSIEYVSPSMFESDVTDAEVYEAIINAAPAGSTIWTRISALPFAVARVAPSLRFNAARNSGLRLMGWN